MLLETNKNSLVFQLPTGGLLLIPISAIEDMRKYQQLDCNDKEAGGVLIGQHRYHTRNGNIIGPIHLEITSCTQPSWWDKRTRFGFIRKSASHIRSVLQAWKNSDGCLSYMGEWHTHPEPIATPSLIDYHQWRSNLTGKIAVLIIIGQKDDWFGYFDGNCFHTLNLTV